jgi:hypothetical protein
MTYLPKPWTLNRDVMESEYAIFEQTGREQNRKVRLCVGLVALLYEMLTVLEGDPLPEVYPVNSDERAQRWLVLVYSSSAFLYANTALDLAVRGHYLEAEAVLRSLLETVAQAEYFSKRRGGCLGFFSSRKGMPDMKKVFTFLRANGQYPKGGPEKIIARFHSSAHANIHSRMRSWALRDANGGLVGFRVHQYHSESFVRVAHHLVMPLLGCHQILFEAFEERMAASKEVRAKWNAGRPFDLIRQEFQDLWFVLGGRSGRGSSTRPMPRRVR